jgi:hypothetical protein
MKDVDVITVSCFLISFHESALPAACVRRTTFVIIRPSVAINDMYMPIFHAVLLSTRLRKEDFDDKDLSVLFGAGVADILYRQSRNFIYELSGVGVAF